MITFRVTDYTNLAPLKCCRLTDRRRNRRTDEVDLLLDLHSLNQRRLKTGKQNPFQLLIFKNQNFERGSGYLYFQVLIIFRLRASSR